MHKLNLEKKIKPDLTKMKRKIFKLIKKILLNLQLHWNLLENQAELGDRENLLIILCTIYIYTVPPYIQVHRHTYNKSRKL